MKVEQLSIFLENKVGRLAEITSTLKAAGINMKAIALADTSEFGILRLIVDKHEEAKAALKDKGYTAATTNVIAVEVDHTPGGLDTIVQILGASQVNIEYMYGFPMFDSKAVMVFRVDKTELAIKTLQEKKVGILSCEQVRQ